MLGSSYAFGFSEPHSRPDQEGERPPDQEEEVCFYIVEALDVADEHIRVDEYEGVVKIDHP